MVHSVECVLPVGARNLLFDRFGHILRFKDDLAEGLVVRLLPRAQSAWMGGVTFSPGAFQAQSDAARELARAVALYALFPSAKWVTFPPWVSGAWCDFAALRVLYRAGYRREADAWLKEYTDAWQDPSKALTDGLDLSVSRMAFRRDWNAKAVWALEQLELPRDRKTREPRNILGGLRKALKRYAAAGRVGDSLSTRDVLFYLSQAFHEDMFAYFQSLGTTVLPMKLDYYELDKDEKK